MLYLHFIFSDSMKITPHLAFTFANENTLYLGG